MSTNRPEPEQDEPGPGGPDLTKRRPAEEQSGPDPTVAHPIPEPGASPGPGGAVGQQPPAYEPPSGYQAPSYQPPSGYQQPAESPGFQAGFQPPGYQTDRSGFGQSPGYGAYPSPPEGYPQPGPQFGYQADSYQEPYPSSPDASYAPQSAYQPGLDTIVDGPPGLHGPVDGYPTALRAPTGLAVTALVLSIVGLLAVCWPPLSLSLSIAGVVAGVVNRGKAAQGLAGGLGLSLAAIIVGAIGALLGVGSLVLYLTR